MTPNASDVEYYQSPFSWRYGSNEMRQVWSETNKRLTWRRIWVALAQVQCGYGLVQPAQVDDLQQHAHQVDIPRALEIEAEIHHDLMAELKTFAEQCPLGGGIIHMGATSMDIEDNADALRLRQSLGLIREKLKQLLMAFAVKIDQYADLPVMAFTHLQPAEPSTLGYRLASYAQDLLEDWDNLGDVSGDVRGKGFKGAVGTAAAYGELIGLERIDEFEGLMSRLLDLPFFPVTTQTYPRKQDYQVISALAGLGGSLYKLAFDLRILQSPPIGELSEPFGEKQVGSSAMPFKRNPINAEKMDSLARSLSVMPQVAWNNAAHSLLERTLDDSANRRTLIPEAFLICDELLQTALKIIKGLRVNHKAIQRNLAAYAPFACTERVMMAAVKAGADRQQMHEKLRELAISSWEVVQEGQANPLVDHLKADVLIQNYISADDLLELTQITHYTGIAEGRSRTMGKNIVKYLS
jgi:adenylosuccinate lyase